MHDLLKEEQLSLEEARKRLPGTPSGQTVWRWARDGIIGPTGKRVRLETIKVGGRRFTSWEAIERFVAATSPLEVFNERTPAQRNKAAAEAIRDLERMGVW